MTLVMNIRVKLMIRYFILSLIFLVGIVALALADGPAVPAGSTSVTGNSMGGTASQPSGLMAFAPFILMFAVLYFLILRPQQKKMKEQQEMLSSLKHGDEVLTSSGILGKVTGITEKVVTVEVADNVRVKMLKSQISQVVKGSIKDLTQ